jgi:Amt family ammonium transporter
MVNVSYIDPSHDVAYAADENSEAIIYNLGDMSFILICTALVWLMIPGVGLLYSGLLRRKNALSMLHLSLAGIAVGSFQWFFWGYSLAFSDGASSFIGDLKYFALRGVLEQPSIGSSRIPALLFALYQCMFACITVVLAVGGFAERGRIGPILLFMFCWLTVVYCPIACWTWNGAGWSFVLGGYDYAGGSPVHISSGTASLAIALYLGKRRGYGTQQLAYKPHNTFFVVLGTAFLWVGWFGFNGGSGLGANLRAVMAMVVTNLAASCGALTWMIMDWRLERKWSAIGFCSGAISGLVGITPASGYVGAPAAVAIGVVTAFFCNLATRLKFILRVDEALDVFATHGIGGICGCILTGLFAQASVAGLDGTEIAGGWIDHHYIQLGYQLADCTAAFGYSFVVTTILCWMFHFIPFLRLKTTEEEEIVGIDDAFLGEFTHDYIAIDPELRLHRVESKSFVDGNGEYANKLTPPGSSVGNEKAGGSRIDP